MMNIRYLFVGIILLTALTLSCANSPKNLASAVNQTAVTGNRLNEKNQFAKTSANELLKSFKEDKTKASESYLGKVIIVDGLVASINEQTEKTPFIVLKSDNPTDNVEVYLKNPDPAKLKLVAKGSKVFIKGNCELESDKVVLKDAFVLAIQNIN